MYRQNNLGKLHDNNCYFKFTFDQLRYCEEELFKTYFYGDRLSNISQDIFDRLVYKNQINEHYLAQVLLPEFLISIAIDQQNLTSRKDCEAFFNGIEYNDFYINCMN